jgi:hypothetical protein
MIMGMTAYTFVHVAISLAGIGTGLVVMYGLLTGMKLARWTAWFLATTVLTSLTGFGFPFHGFTPAIGTGILSMIVLVPAIYALYVRGLAGFWRWVYVIGATAALYLNVFVLVVQLFVKVPALTALAPTQSEPPFTGTQAAVLLVFVILGILNLRRFHPLG